MPLMLCLLLAAARPTVAVLYFDYAGQDQQLTVLKKGFAQILISDLSGLESVQLVERERLEAVMAELALDTSGKVNTATAAKLGKLLGAKWLVLGSYFDLLGVLRVDARVVEVETSKVLHSVGSNGAPGELMDVEQKVASGLAKIFASLAQTRAPDPLPAAPKLKTKTAVRYSKALDAADKGDKRVAKQEMTAVLQEQPDFRLARDDLKKMMQ